MKSEEEYLKEYQEERKKRRQEIIEMMIDIKKEDKKLAIFVLSFFVLLFLGLDIAGRIRTKELEENKAFTTGQITNHGKRNNGTFYLKYSYTVNGKNYKDLHTGVRILPCNYQYFEGKYFPVIYSTKNPKKSVILMDSYAFESWGLAFPDSLKWAEDYSKWGLWDCK